MQMQIYQTHVIKNTLEMPIWEKRLEVIGSLAHLVSTPYCSLPAAEGATRADLRHCRSHKQPVPSCLVRSLHLPISSTRFLHPGVCVGGRVDRYVCVVCVCVCVCLCLLTRTLLSAVALEDGSAPLVFIGSWRNRGDVAAIPT